MALSQTGGLTFSARFFKLGLEKRDDATQAGCLQLPHLHPHLLPGTGFSEIGKSHVQ